MSPIEIRKIGITKLDVDCVVNAANSALQAGGGVCGAIFAEAGAGELQAACNRIGGCRTGGAVITPGFKLKAKYIIHAVGPRWDGGHSGEEQQLYSCYQASMQLVRENGCHSVAFPLISSGIYGYPKDKAWRVGLRAVMDFQQENNDYFIEVIFGVLEDAALSMGNSILKELCEAESSNACLPLQIIRFHKIDEPNGYLSNWYLRDFVVDGTTYCCVEQYMMSQKALLFGDKEIAAQIMETRDQQTMKDLGQQARNFKPVVWDGQKQLIVYTGVLAKFEQNPDLAAMLLATGDAQPVECAYKDLVWGIGLGMNDPNAVYPEKWRGQNLLGYVLSAVRAELRRRG